MAPVHAASFLVSVDAGRATQVLKQVAPARVADILRNVSSASHREQLLSGLPEGTRATVLGYFGG